MRGTKPMPEALRALHGRTSHMSRPKPSVSARPTETAPPAPDWLTTGQREIWDEVMKHAPRNVLARADTETVVAFVLAVEIRRKASEQLSRARGLIVRTPNGTFQPHPLVAMVTRQSLTILRCAEALGLSPVGRTRLSASLPGGTYGGDGDSFEQWSTDLDAANNVH